MPYGDSITEGGFIVNGQWHTEGGYRIVLWQVLTQAGYQTHFVGSTANGDFPEAHHEGHAGWRIDQVDAQSQQWVTQAAPDFIILMIGTNDCIQNFQSDTMVNRLETLMDHIQQSAPKAQLFVASLFYSGGAQVIDCIKRYNQALIPMVQQKAQSDSRVHFVDFTSVIGNGQDGTPADLIDGIHPGPPGYAKMGQAWFEDLRPYLPAHP